MSSLGFNTGYIEDLYQQYLEDSGSVSESWQDFFADYRPDRSFIAAREVRRAKAPPGRAIPVEVSSDRGDGALVEPVASARTPGGVPEPDVEKIRGAQARIVENMEASLGIPTATSARIVPVKLMSENRTLVNAFQRNRGSVKVSFTHLITWAVAKALSRFPNMNTTFRQERGGPRHVIPKQVNLGLAIDVERRGKRILLVPNIKAIDRMNFARFLGVYNDLVRRVRDGKLDPADFEGTTATLTNPGMIGTTMSVARLMPGQGVIIGAGAIGYPAEYYSYPPDVVGEVGISQVMTITSTYDHRVIQGAESGAFLSYLANLLLGEDSFYRDLFQHLDIPYQPYAHSTDTTPQLGGERRQGGMDVVRKQASVLQFIRSYRVRGHLQADINPLGLEWRHHPELDPSRYGLTIWDLDRKFVTGGIGGKDVSTLREITEILRETYSRKVGIEYMHISSPMEKRWLQDRLEPTRCEEPIPIESKRRILQKLNAAEAFERFIHTKYVGHKRFSLEGAESVIPMIDSILSDAAEQETVEVVIGMAHRGRLNVLANILEKPYEAIFSEFEGELDPAMAQGSGDVKYHLGAVSQHTSPGGAKVTLTLASNPSHLESVNPIVQGMVRARQDLLRYHESSLYPGGALDAVIPLLIHGDAAFSGQGVVYETLHLSQLRAYKTGGTIHIIINNQIGFTTQPSDARSSTYATDVARTIQAPIFHVNGDDPEACMRVARLALDYRNVFNKDVVIDMLCYRTHGHNEGDEPTYTQPLLYRKIEAKRSPRKLYTETLLRRGDLDPDEAERMLDDYRDRLQEAFDRTRELNGGEAAGAASSSPSDVPGAEAEAGAPPEPARDPEPSSGSDSTPDTSVSEACMEEIAHTLFNLPDDFNVHRKLIRHIERQRDRYLEDRGIDWALAEALAFGSLLIENTTVRMSGQDTRRGTFSHRHAVLYDQETGVEYIPLNNMRRGQSELLIFDSPLSEFAVCGFEYGYSLGDTSALVIWEAQFGDFANGAQVIFDQFLSAAEEKWGQQSSLVLLLPHGYEGQGPEHSSAGLQRFLQMCAEDNMNVCNFTTPANYFHALRRQIHRRARKPLVVMAPKSLLRHSRFVSPRRDFTEGRFLSVIPSDAVPGTVRKHVLCSGKVYYDMLRVVQDAGEDSIAFTRIEQCYPFPEEEVRAEMARFAEVEEVCWVQEEPSNMGAWSYVRPRLEELLEEVRGGYSRVRYVGRPASASTATGSTRMHELEVEAIMREVLDSQ